MGIQLAHAGRKSEVQGDIFGPTTTPFSNNYQTPKALASDQITDVINSFANAAVRAVKAGFDFLEIHAAHGYLISEFLSPIVNTRNDQYGGTIENRVRLLDEVLDAVRAVIPTSMPIIVRVSADDYIEGGNNADSMIEIINLIKAKVDSFHISTGGVVEAPVKIFPGYQVQHSDKIKNKCHVHTIAVGLINEEAIAEEILQNNRADMIAFGREILRNPYLPMNIYQKHANRLVTPVQYERAFANGDEENFGELS